MSASVAPALRPAHPAEAAPPRDRLLRLPEVETLVGIRKSSIYELMRQGKFPPCIRITSRLSAWPESAIYQWVQDRIHKGGV